METRWLYVTSEELEQLRDQVGGVCVIPIGCVEAHGIHLPLGCDTMIAEAFCTRAAEIAPVTVFPAMYFGEKSGAGEFPGTIVLPTTLILDLLEACCKEIYRNGFKMLLHFLLRSGDLFLQFPGGHTQNTCP